MRRCPVCGGSYRKGRKAFLFHQEPDGDKVKTTPKYVTVCAPCFRKFAVPMLTVQVSQ